MKPTNFQPEGIFFLIPGKCSLDLAYDMLRLPISSKFQTPWVLVVVPIVLSSVHVPHIHALYSVCTVVTVWRLVLVCCLIDTVLYQNANLYFQVFIVCNQNILTRLLRALPGISDHFSSLLGSPSSMFQTGWAFPHHRTVGLYMCRGREGAHVLIWKCL